MTASPSKPQLRSTAERTGPAPPAPAGGTVRPAGFETRQQVGRAVLLAVDAAVIVAALVAAYGVRFWLGLGEAPGSQVRLQEYLKLTVLLVPGILLLCQSWSLYRLASRHSAVEEAAVVVRAVSAATALVLALTFFYREFSYSRLVFAVFWPLCIGGMVLAQLGFRHWQLRRYSRGCDLRRTVVIGRAPSYLAQRLATEPVFGLQVVGCVAPPPRGPESRALQLVDSARGGRRPPAAGGDMPELGGLAALDEVLAEHAVEEVVVLDQELDHADLLHVIDTCERRGVRVRMIPAIYDLFVQPGDFSYVHGVPLLRVDERRYLWLMRLIKRCFDMIVSGVLLVLLLPVMALIWLVIRLDSPGPALFVQRRAGEHGRPFTMLKFRTMAVDAEQRLHEVVDVGGLAQPVFKIERDPRVTRVGRWLRRSSLDELPQLINVLRGEMSLVGPRPEELSMAARYDVWQRRRLKVKPGITGLQQVEARGTLSDLNDRVRLDVYYIRKQSLLLDVVILARTVWAVLRGHGAA